MSLSGIPRVTGALSNRVVSVVAVLGWLFEQ